MEGGIARTERLKKAATHVEPLPEILATGDGTITPAADVFGCPAGKTFPMAVPARDYDGQHTDIIIH